MGEQNHGPTIRADDRGGIFDGPGRGLRAIPADQDRTIVRRSCDET
jgi:hypothetical protein